MNGGGSHDPGLQTERTLLAWSRTVLVVAVDAALVIRTGLFRDRPVLTLLGSLIAVTAVVLHLHASARRRAMDAGPAPRSPSARSLRTVTAAVVVCAVATAWCVHPG
ncbi:DUF202 domain-containing protein [Streptomyces sp. TP-A0874]|uniref:DUF202 domain-containing protein n=1 Tax=Streptomyces sp. TP-A0874 TaxID=549819 RepID=UPI000852D3AF|nr:DUF202 domain-containing protein [Streptomyces sp. TP-A0874]